jgi:anti-sigma B factor antagonist
MRDFMSVDPPELRLEVSGAGDQTVARVAGCRALTEENVEALSQQLSALTDGREGQHLLLDLGTVQYLTSSALGALVIAHKRVRDGGGRLTLANALPAVCEIFAVTRLDRVLELQPESKGIQTPEESRAACFPNIEADRASVSVADASVVELVLLVPALQAERLEQAATHHGLTVGAFLRRLIQRGAFPDAFPPFLN